MLKIKYIGTRPLMMPDGTYIYNGEARVISEKQADALQANKDLFEGIGEQAAPQVEEVETSEASEAFEDAEPVEANETPEEEPVVKRTKRGKKK